MGIKTLSTYVISAIKFSQLFAIVFVVGFISGIAIYISWNCIEKLKLLKVLDAILLSTQKMTFFNFPIQFIIQNWLIIMMTFTFEMATLT